MNKSLRDIEISPPTFDTLEEALEYAQRFHNPQNFVGEFIQLLKWRVSFSVYPRYDQ